MYPMSFKELLSPPTPFIFFSLSYHFPFTSGSSPGWGRQIFTSLQPLQKCCKHFQPVWFLTHQHTSLSLHFPSRSTALVGIPCPAQEAWPAALAPHSTTALSQGCLPHCHPPFFPDKTSTSTTVSSKSNVLRQAARQTEKP